MSQVNHVTLTLYFMVDVTWSGSSGARPYRRRPANSSTCWKVGRLVALIVFGISPGANPVREASERHSLGLGWFCEAASRLAPSASAVQRDARQAASSPLPQ